MHIGNKSPENNSFTGLSTEELGTSYAQSQTGVVRKENRQPDFYCTSLMSPSLIIVERYTYYYMTRSLSLNYNILFAVYRVARANTHYTYTGSARRALSYVIQSNLPACTNNFIYNTARHNICAWASDSWIMTSSKSSYIKLLQTMGNNNYNNNNLKRTFINAFEILR